MIVLFNKLLNIDFIVIWLEWIIMLFFFFVIILILFIVLFVIIWVMSFLILIRLFNWVCLVLCFWINIKLEMMFFICILMWRICGLKFFLSCFFFGNFMVIFVRLISLEIGVLSLWVMLEVSFFFLRYSV